VTQCNYEAQFGPVQTGLGDYSGCGGARQDISAAETEVNAELGTAASSLRCALRAATSQSEITTADAAYIQSANQLHGQLDVLNAMNSEVTQDFNGNPETQPINWSVFNDVAKDCVLGAGGEMAIGAVSGAGDIPVASGAVVGCVGHIAIASASGGG
jgi:hypothetical protein